MPGTVADDGKSDFLLDRIDALRVLRAESEHERGRMLEEIGGSGRAEQDIVAQLSMVRPLWRPDRFEEAHRLAMRSLEVLDRNGARQPHMPRLGPFRPVASFLVQQVTRWIVRGHENSLATNIRELYERREANSSWGSADHHMLRRARLDAARVEAGIRSNPLGLPAFLLGGAFLSGIVSGLGNVIRGALEDEIGVIVFAAVAVTVLGALSWVALYAASIARRRIGLSTDQPIAALYDTIGACGDPPKDQSVSFAVYAIVLLALAGIFVPLAIYLVVRLT